MSRYGFVLVSHSEKLADGLKDMLEEMNGGDAEIESAPGQGTRVRLTWSNPAENMAVSPMAASAPMMKISGQS